MPAAVNIAIFAVICTVAVLVFAIGVFVMCAGLKAEAAREAHEVTLRK